MNKYVVLIITLIFTALCFLMINRAGSCGTGAYNKFPFGLKANYINGFWIENKYGLGVIHDSFDSDYSLFDIVHVRKIKSFAYSDDYFYASIESHENKNLIAVIEGPEPSWRKIRFINADDFSEKYNSNINWIEPTSLVCRSGLILDDFLFFVKSLLHQ